MLLALKVSEFEPLLLEIFDLNPSGEKQQMSPPPPNEAQSQPPLSLHCTQESQYSPSSQTAASPSSPPISNPANVYTDEGHRQSVHTSEESYYRQSTQLSAGKAADQQLMDLSGQPLNYGLGGRGTSSDFSLPPSTPMNSMSIDQRSSPEGQVINMAVDQRSNPGPVINYPQPLYINTNQRSDLQSMHRQTVQSHSPPQTLQMQTDMLNHSKLNFSPPNQISPESYQGSIQPPLIHVPSSTIRPSWTGPRTTHPPLIHIPRQHQTQVPHLSGPVSPLTRPVSQPRVHMPMPCLSPVYSRSNSSEVSSSLYPP